MNPKPEVEVSKLDTVKWALAVVLVIAAVVGFYYFADKLFVLRVGGLLTVVAVAVGIVATTRLGRETWGYLGDSRVELRKVVWPTRQETMQTTLAVVLMVMVMGVFMWLLDMVLLWGVRAITGQGA